MGIPRLRSFTGPHVLSYGFRPFFLLGSLYAGLSVLFWLPMYSGLIESSSAFASVDWHIHEMLFGYLPAIVTGFLLTAIPNWTGRLPVQGLPLLALVILWIAGRVATFYSSDIGWMAAAAVDVSFLAAVTAAAAREIIAGKNWRNLKVLIPLAVLVSANAAFHLEAHFHGISNMSRRLGIAAAIMFIIIIGGRIIPSFTRNWLVRENPGRLPAPFDRFDVVTIALSTAALGSWTVLPENPASGVLLSVAAGCQTARLARWAGDRTIKDPLVAILHLAYGFVPLGLMLLALSIFLPIAIPQAAGIHALGGGAIGSMTMAVMARATLGHTGRQLKAGASTVFLFAAILLAGSCRILGALAPHAEMITVAGILWATAFLGFAALYGSALVGPKVR
ncbi:NnrS family protein [Mesorhizobium sp.]|uniref:NnrS family protein n=1 Tax=Mesorhizobium sp. TaxID=1871066 RepID=UPI000FEAA954|nr:NnrS family protein [Mesorhizobium sp.]RWP16333.1 MAG: NnrS family protein [Mesorhizobium sp.]RWQ26042.1 MAG: NnrS family protein [Mesorhizobium sp.]